MNNLLRCLAWVPETAVYGPSYGLVNFLARSPKPLEPEPLWKLITDPLPPVIDWVRLNYPPPLMRRLMLARFLSSPHKVGIAKHYDVSNDFYELFLDKKYMLYSCADYITGRETLEEAQTNKVNFIMNLLDPRPGEKILELGCGWGGMLQEVFSRTGDRENLCGYTLSERQVEYNDEVRHFNVQLKNFITDELPPEAFDKIFSIGAWEHVRRRDLRPTLDKLYSTLKPGGKLVMHYFCGLARTVQTPALVAQIFFRGIL